MNIAVKLNINIISFRTELNRTCTRRSVTLSGIKTQKLNHTIILFEIILKFFTWSPGLNN